MQQELGATEMLANLSIGAIVLSAFVLTVIRMVLVPLRSPAARWVAELVESLIIAGVLVFLVIRPFFLQAFFIPSQSMEPTLMGHPAGFDATTGETNPSEIKDHIFVNKLGYRLGSPHRGDVIVFLAPKVADAQSAYEGKEPQENILIKRLIGVGGDRIFVKPDADGILHVWRNGRQLTEPYIKEPMRDRDRAVYGVGQELTLKPDELFVMGDNRNNSNDSRFWGPLKRDRVIGKAVFIFWPLSRIRFIR